MFSRTSLDKLINKIDCSNVLKDGKIESVQCPRSAWTAASVVLVGSLICRLHQDLAESVTSVKHHQMVTSYLKCLCRKQWTDETDL